MTVQEYNKKLKSINKPKLKREAVKKAEPEIVNLNRLQLEKGLTIDETKITPKYRNPVYATFKNSMNPRPGFGTPDLKLSGAFHDSLKVLFGNGSFKIKGFTDYAEKLEAKYKGIYGLTKEHFKKVQQTATHIFVELWKQKMK